MACLKTKILEALKKPIDRDRRRYEKIPEPEEDKTDNKLPESDYDGMGNFSRFGRPPK